MHIAQHAVPASDFKYGRIYSTLYLLILRLELFILRPLGGRSLRLLNSMKTVSYTFFYPLDFTGTKPNIPLLLTVFNMR